MLGAEVAGLFAFDVHDANEAVLGDERDGEFGADIRIDGDVNVGGGDVVEEDGLARKGDLADNATAHGETHAFGLGCVADLEAHAEVFAAVVEKKNGEDAVMDDGANKLGGAIEEGLQIERGVERVGHLHEVVEVGDFDAWVGEVYMRVRIRWIGGTVIAFELVRMGRTWMKRGWRLGGHTYRRQ